MRAPRLIPPKSTLKLHGRQSRHALNGCDAHMISLSRCGVASRAPSHRICLIEANSLRPPALIHKTRIGECVLLSRICETTTTPSGHQLNQRRVVCADSAPELHASDGAGFCERGRLGRWLDRPRSFAAKAGRGGQPRSVHMATPPSLSVPQTGGSSYHTSHSALSVCFWRVWRPVRSHPISRKCRDSTRSSQSLQPHVFLHSSQILGCLCRCI